VGDAAELTASHEDYSAACQLHANSWPDAVRQKLAQFSAIMWSKLLARSVRSVWKLLLTVTADTSTASNQPTNQTKQKAN
jgi:hypothetical protein